MKTVELHDLSAEARSSIVPATGRVLARALAQDPLSRYAFPEPAAREPRTSDDAVEESLRANDYTFTEAGRRFG